MMKLLIHWKWTVRLVNKTVHIVFGNVTHIRNYARAMAVDPRTIIAATQPEHIQGRMVEAVDTIKVIRFPEDVWQPTTFPCEKRVTETERIIKGYQRLGVTVVEVTE